MASNTYTTTTTVTIPPPTTLNEKANMNDKRRSKPLPIKPLPLPPNVSLIDDSSRSHVLKLLNHWLAELNIPIKPWADVLFNIALTLYGKTMNASSASTAENALGDDNSKSIWIQTFTNNSPMESKFLTNVFHGKELSNDELSIDFPIGGTIRIYGLNDETISSKLIDLVQTLVYLTYSLYLETYVMRDSHVQLVITSNSANITTVASSILPFSNKQNHQPSPNSGNDSGLTKKSSVFFNWIKKFTPLHHTVTLPPTPPPSIASNEKSATPKRRSNPLNSVGEGIRRGLSLSNIGKRYSIPPPLLQPADFETIKPGDPHRFYKLKQKIEHAYISTSPECHFPYPALLNRLEIEEDDLISEQRKILASTPTNDIECLTPTTARPIPQHRRRSSLMSSFSSYNNNNKRNSITTAEVQLPQSITAYSSIRVPGLLVDSKKGLEHLNLDTSSLESFKQHQSITVGFSVYPIGCPDRPCLGPIMSKIDYFRYHAPKNATSIFPSIDQSLGHTIRHWCTISQTSCQTHMDEQLLFIPGLKVRTPIPPAILNYSNSINHGNHINGSTNTTTATTTATVRPDPLNEAEYHKNSESSISTVNTPASVYPPPKAANRHCGKFHGCSQPLIDHVYTFSHGIGKINVYISMDKTCLPANKDKITTWIACSTCDKSTARILMNENTAEFSFAKYLELIFYSSKLASPEPFCEHTRKNATSKNVITRCFHYNGVTVKLIYEDAKYYELRVPRIQMATEEEVVQPPFQDFNEFGAPRIIANTLKDWKHKSATQDVDSFFQSVRTHLDLLNHYTKAEGRRKIRGFQNDPAAAKQCQAELKDLDVEIKALSKRLDTDHQNLLQILQDTHLNELNDFRRYFALQSESIIQYLMDWQNTKCEEVTDTIGWDSPDYISSKTVHCFPGSSVLVREDEPTSLIAYTLSSNDYIQEILFEEESENGSTYSSKRNVSMPSLSSAGSTTTDLTNEPIPPVPPLPTPFNENKKALPLPPPPPQTNVLDGYYSSIERKYISPSTGATSETASFRTMVIEVVKSSVVEAQMTNSKRLEDWKARLSPWSRKQEELLETEGDLKRQQLSERTLKPLVAIQQQQQQQQVETKEVKVASYFYENGGATKDQWAKKTVSPHIKHKFVHDGMEFTCIVYYAKEFETLRKRCDINQLIIESLSRCQTWTASGGKSRSHFYKTQDDRLVVKEMMNAWNVAEKDAFLKFAPKYFEHMKRSANEPSVLAKIFGFFTIRMKNTIDKKSLLLNLDVLVMEHLFFNQNIIRRFDFKGIQDRHVEEFRKQQKDSTLWDGDWINEYRTRLPVHEQSKAVLELAIANDTEFLSKCNIMDYSLLVGIDQDKYEMTVGIVDFIGAYTWYKKLENRSKSISHRSKEVTVVPPDQYRLRFTREVCDYFIPVPGKFDLVAPSNTLPSLLI